MAIKSAANSSRNTSGPGCLKAVLCYKPDKSLFVRYMIVCFVSRYRWIAIYPVDSVNSTDSTIYSSSDLTYAMENISLKNWKLTY